MSKEKKFYNTYQFRTKLKNNSKQIFSTELDGNIFRTVAKIL